MKLLADTSALLALALADDKHHREAVRFLIDHPQARFVVTELVLSELVTLVRRRLDAAKAAAAGRSVLESRRFELLFIDKDILDGALGKIERYRDKQLSLADATSFEVIDRLGLGGAFSFDRDFRDCGYDMVPEM